MRTNTHALVLYGFIPPLHFEKWFSLQFIWPSVQIRSDELNGNDRKENIKSNKRYGTSITSFILKSRGDGTNVFPIMSCLYQQTLAYLLPNNPDLITRDSVMTENGESLFNVSIFILVTLKCLKPSASSS